VIDARIQPATVVNDPELTVLTPDWLWVSTGMRALDHAVEAVYSRRHQILPDTLASKAIRLLFQHLPGSIEAAGGEALAHRGHCQFAAWFSIYGAMNTGLGISHAMGHQIGPAWDVPHGFNSCITLPHAMRFMADQAAHLFGPIAEALRIEFDPGNPGEAALACADAVAKFIAGFDMIPHTLKDLEIERGEIGKVAEAIYRELRVYPVTERETSIAEIDRLLADAYDGYKA
jgi:alcohol dehydrogenase